MCRGTGFRPVLGRARMAQRAFAEAGAYAGKTRPMRPVDLVHLAKQCMGNEALELDVLRLFDKTVDTYFERLKVASTFDDMAITIHSIKGAAAGVGAWGIAEQARAIEADLRDGFAIRSERIDDLGVIVEEVRDFIARMLAGNSV
jgi:HPt (histidine-containing phosphotransfer) domain-containing protein